MMMNRNGYPVFDAGLASWNGRMGFTEASTIFGKGLLNAFYLRSPRTGVEMFFQFRSQTQGGEGIAALQCTEYAAVAGCPTTTYILTVFHD